MNASRSGIARAATRVLPASVLGVAVLTGLGGSLQAVNPSVATPERATHTPTEVTPVEVSDAAIEHPASMTSIAVNAGDVTAQLSIVSAAGTKSVPSAALAAYQRAATVINASDRSCHIDWELIAAIGRVESDHGQHAGSRLDASGVARPAIIGVPLDGRGTALIEDTDGGQYDNDTVHDRAVGPLQFIPSTWSVVGVDADGDGIRNPQDIDDAALAAAVYLCSGKEDLSTAAGRSSAVFRYNHSRSYVDVVLDLMNKYVAGNYAATPTATQVSASTTVTSNLVGTSAIKTTARAARVTKERASATVARDRIKPPSGALTALEGVPTLTDTDPVTPEEPSVPPATTPTDPPETGQPDDPAPSEPTGETTPTDPPVDEQPRATPPEDLPEPSPADNDETCKPEAPGDEALTDDSSSDPATLDDEALTDVTSSDPEGVLVDDPATPDVDESIPVSDLPLSGPGCTAR